MTRNYDLELVKSKRKRELKTDRYPREKAKKKRAQSPHCRALIQLALFYSNYILNIKGKFGGKKVE